MDSLSQPIWCHTCQKQVSSASSDVLSCNVCGGEVVEIMEGSAQTAPNFVPYTQARPAHAPDPDANPFAALFGSFAGNATQNATPAPPQQREGGVLNLQEMLQNMVGQQAAQGAGGAPQVFYFGGGDPGFAVTGDPEIDADDEAGEEEGGAVRNLSPIQQMLVNLTRVVNGNNNGPAGAPNGLNFQNIMQMMGGRQEMGNMGDYVADANFENILGRLFNESGNNTRPTDPDTVRNLPLETVGPADHGESCPVCQDDFKMGEPVKVISCCHRFHVDCLDPWLKMNNTCPVCRFELKAASLNQAQSDPPPLIPASEAPARTPTPPSLPGSPEPPTPDLSDDEDQDQGELKKDAPTGERYENMFL